MKLLKKASFQDIIRKESILQKYKEIELYTTWADIEIEQADDLILNLKKNKAIIRAIHCPSSLYKTSSDNDTSTNYMSICEVIKCAKSKEKYEKLLKFAERINQNQWTNSQVQNEESEIEIKNDKIILILHAGCELGCVESNGIKNKCTVIDNITDDIKKIFQNESVQIVIENVTPYIDSNNRIAKGENCGWNNEDKWNVFSIAKKIKVNVCIDICHIFASHNIINGNTDYINALSKYKKYIEENKYTDLIGLFHISNYDKNGVHGAQFQDNDFDTRVVDSIREFCSEIAPSVYATLEVAEGNNFDKGNYNFERLMLKLSEKHKSGLFGELLNEECNNDLKKFFDNLYQTYSREIINVFDIKQLAMEIKKFIISNTYIDLGTSNGVTPFGVTKDSDKINTSMFRMQAYIFYTRWCNLGKFLSEYYDATSIIPEKNRASDFGLALKYYMFNDEVKQVEFTGVAFHFNVNWLPRKETFFRFYDGINSSRIPHVKVKPLNHIINIIREHIQGTNCSLYSCGKNFGVCLFKYWQPLGGSQGAWTVRVYKDNPINFIKYNDRIYSIQAFMQSVENEEIDISAINDFSFDMSVFNNGRGEVSGSKKDASSLYSLFRFYNNVGGIAENVGSISDGEIVFLNLSNHTQQYVLDNYNSLILFKAYLERKSKNLNLITIENNLKKLINNGSPCIQTHLNISALTNMLDYVRQENNSSTDLLERNPYADSAKDINNWFKQNYNKM